MPPKKVRTAKISLAEFNETAGGSVGNWADEMEDMPSSAVPGFASAQPGFASQYGSNAGGYGSTDRRIYDTSAPRDPIFATNTRGGNMERAGWTTRPEVPMPDRPPYTAHIGNLSFEATDSEIGEFFAGSGASVKGVRLVRDRENDRPRGFGYVEFNDVESLKKALPLSGSPLAGREIRVTVAEAPKGGFGDREPERDLDWGSARGARGPLPALDRPARGYESRGGSGSYEPRSGGNESRGAGYEAREPRAPREPERDLDWGSARSRGPLPPVERSQPERGHQSRPAYGERRDSERRPYGERREERRERDNAPDLDWSSRRGPLSPTADGAPKGPTERRKISLTPRTNADGASSPAVSAPNSNRASPFGAARAVDTSAAEKKAEEKRQQLLRDREAANAAREEKKKERKFDTRTDKPFDILRKTEELNVNDDDEESQNVEAKADAELAAIEESDKLPADAELKVESVEQTASTDDDGWNTIKSKK